MQWLTDMLEVWAVADSNNATQTLGYPTVSPSFKGMLSCDQASDIYEYSQDEIEAICTAVQWLARRHPQQYAAICRRFKPLQFGNPQHGDGPQIDLAFSHLEKKLKTLL